MVRKLLTTAVLLAFATQIVVAAEEMTIWILGFSQAGEYKFNMFPTRRLSRARMEAEVKFDGRRAQIELKYEEMNPAVLFGGDVSCYVLWAVNREGWVNLGEFDVRENKRNGRLRFSTGLRLFALLITAEAYSTVKQPSPLVVFWNDSVATPPIQVDTLVFGGFTEGPSYTREDAGSIVYNEKKSLALVQAERIFAVATRMGAEQYAFNYFVVARSALGQATDAQARSKRKDVERYSRTVFDACNRAIEEAIQGKERDELENLLAQRLSQIEDLKSRLEAAEGSIETLTRDRDQALSNLRVSTEELVRLDDEMQSTLAEKATLEDSLLNLRGQMRQVEQEKAAAQQRLQNALSQVADTRESVRGFIVNLPDILFDVGKKGLKTDAKLAIAKLAGILLILQDLNLRIEGHTDSTGSAERNLSLSEARAQSVFDFLVEAGLAESRIKIAGYGEERPIADNATAAGRRQNRRVEIIIAEGVIAEQ
jgi:outer membrane protein OmpA-like peptidoglycan-associated protein